MKHYAGLDISMKEAALCIVDQEGKVIYEKTLPLEPDVIFNHLTIRVDSIESVGIETGSMTRWLTLELRKLDINAIAIDARKMSGLLKFNCNKNDKNDAKGIANAMRTNMYKEVYVKSDKNALLSALVSTRTSLVNQRSKNLVTIRGHLKSLGIRLSRLSHKNASEILDLIEVKLPKHLEMSIKSLANTVVAINEEVSKLNESIKEFVKENKVAQNIQTISGVGPIVTAAYIIEIGDPLRFSSSRSVGGYFGLTPRLYESGGTSVMGRISKFGRSSVRSLLYQAAHCMLTRSKKRSKLKDWGMKIWKKKGLKKASVAVARKLAVIMHKMLITGEDFNDNIFIEVDADKKKVVTA